MTPAALQRTADVRLYRRMPQRRFPPPWSVDEADSKLDRRCFIVRDATGRRSPTSISRMSAAGDRRRTSSPATKPGASPPTSQSCSGWSLNPRPPAEQRFAGCPYLRRSGRSLYPRGVLDPSAALIQGRGEGEEGFPVFRIARRLGPGQALLSVGAVLPRADAGRVPSRRYRTEPQDLGAPFHRATRYAPAHLRSVRILGSIKREPRANWFSSVIRVISRALVRAA